MKREGQLLEKIVDVENIALAAYKAFRGKCDSSEILAFRENFLGNILEIRNAVLNGNFEVGNYKHFVIYEPKKRNICAVPLRQRILHHAIMNVCHDIFERNLIYDCYASRPMKGTHRAILRVQQKSKSFKYYVKLDIRKFFENIDHSILIQLLSRFIKDYPLLSLFKEIIESYGSCTGLPIGALTSQYLANFYLSSADHYMKETMKAPVYIRYMDDVIIMAKDKTMLMELMRGYSEFVVRNLKLTVKAPIVGNIYNGIPFLGYRIFRNRILMNGKGKRRYKKNIRLLNCLYEKSVITEREYSDRLMSNLAYACFADSYSFRQKVIG